MEAIAELSPSRQRLAHIFEFSRDVLGYDQLDDLHVDWFDHALNEPKLLFLAPRNHFKTTCYTISYPLFRLVEDSDIRILLIHEILKHAQSYLRGIKTHITRNEKFRARYGHLDTDAHKWTENSILLRRARIRNEPSISITGVLGTVNSQHVDLIVIDDPCSDKNTATPAQRNKLIRWFGGTILPILEPDGQIIVGMTRWNTGDLAGHILKEAGFEDWKKIVLAAEWKDDGGKRNILFPNRWPAEKLDALKRQMGTMQYNCQMLNDPSGLEGACFKVPWLIFYDTIPDDLRKELTIYSGVDLAMTRRESERGSWFVICTIGIDRDGNIWILDWVRRRIDFPSQIAAIKRNIRVWKPVLMGIESNSYQEAMPQTLLNDPELAGMPIRPITNYGDKDRRIMAMSPLFEQGKMRVGRQMEDFQEEYRHFPNVPSPDQLDALEIAVGTSREMGVQPTIDVAGF